MLGVPAHAAPDQQAPTPPAGREVPTSPAPIERLGKGLMRVGTVKVDTNKREISVPGKINDVQAVEFIACTKNGFKAYESALELDTNAINFNLGLILIGLDKARSVGPRMVRDPNPPSGDPVEIWVEWKDGETTRRIRAEHLIHNRDLNKPLPMGPWVYTGSAFVPGTNSYQADVDGVLIGFVHTPSAVIDQAGPIIGEYSANRIDPSLNLKADTPVILTVRALERR